MKTKLLTICLLLFTSQVFADDINTNIKKLNSLNGCESCNLKGLNLSNAFLSNANLNKANLSGASLSETNLIGANLKDSILLNANMFRAILCNTNTPWEIDNTGCE